MDERELEYEFQVEIDGTNYGMGTLTSVSIKQPLFDKFDVGLACCAQMTVQYYVKEGIEPSRGAKLVPRYREKGTSNKWEQIGVFYIDLRTERAGKKTLTCYDSMMKADTPFFTEGDVGEWPRSMKIIVYQIAAKMGITVDPRTKLVDSYTMDFPNEDHMRTMLEYIAAAHAGNWIITAANQLLLVPLTTSMPPETHYLVTEWGLPIVFGEDRILV